MSKLQKHNAELELQREQAELTLQEKTEELKGSRQHWVSLSGVGMAGPLRVLGASHIKGMSAFKRRLLHPVCASQPAALRFYPGKRM